MTNNDFIVNLKERWNGINSAVIQDIVKELQAYTNEDISTIWDTFIRTYNKVSAPVFASILDAVKQSGCKKAMRGKGQRYIWLCKCGTYWDNRLESLAGYRCPNCHSLHSDSTAIKYDQSMKVKWLQQYCLDPQKKSMCKLYGESGALGNICDIWGTGRTSGECYSCACSSCCRTANKDRLELISREEAINKAKNGIKLKITEML